MISVHDTFAEQLVSQGFTGDITNNRDMLHSYATDESIFYIEPQLVIAPRTIDDIGLAVNLASKLTTQEHPVHLTVRAAGTGLSGGSINDSVVVDITHYDQIYSIKETEYGAVIDTDVGVYYRDLEKQMDEVGVYIPSMPASKDICTIGGMVANNAAGADSFNYGHTAEFVESMDVILGDGQMYTIEKLGWDEFQTALARQDQLGAIYRNVWESLQQHEDHIAVSHPSTNKNSSGYALWDIVSTSVAEFTQGKGVFDLGRIFSGSQGTLGIIVRLRMRAVPIHHNQHLMSIPIDDLSLMGNVIDSLVNTKPINIEMFDKHTFRAALKHPEFFIDRIDLPVYKSVIRAMKYIAQWRLRNNIPQYMVLVSYDNSRSSDLEKISDDLKSRYSVAPWIVETPLDQQALWQMRRASYSLSKMSDPTKRPAAFLEDMVIPTEHLSSFLSTIQSLFDQHNITAFIHGHGGDGHLHFYPLMDFTDPNTAGTIVRLADIFFKTATRYGGSICGEHNDGIIRTPYIHLVFDPTMLQLFAGIEDICDPQHIFNPGKKTHPKFDITSYIRHTN